jgi:hypothetical protein
MSDQNFTHILVEKTKAENLLNYLLEKPAKEVLEYVSTLTNAPGVSITTNKNEDSNQKTPSPSENS